MKINFTINEELAEKMDNYINDNYMTRSGFISLAINEYLTRVEVITAVNDMSKAMKKIAETGEIDDATLSQLEAFEIFANMLVSK